MYGLKNKRGKRQTYTLDRAHLPFVRHPRVSRLQLGSSRPRSRRGRASRSSSASARSTAARAHGATAPTTRRWRSRATGSSSPRRSGKSVIIGSRVIRNQGKIMLANKLRRRPSWRPRTTRCGSSARTIRQQRVHRADRQDPDAAEMTGAATDVEEAAYEAYRRAGAGRRGDGRRPGRRAWCLRRFVGDPDDSQASPGRQPVRPGRPHARRRRRREAVHHEPAPGAARVHRVRRHQEQHRRHHAPRRVHRRAPQRPHRAGRRHQQDQRRHARGQGRLRHDASPTT